MVPVLRYGQAELVKSTLVVGYQNRIECRGNSSSVGTPLGHQTLVSLPACWCMLVGCHNLRKQKRIVLESGMQIRSAAWTFLHLLSLVVKALFPITDVAPWRAKQPLTVRLVAQCLRMKFSKLAFKDSFNRKSSIFTFPNSAATEDCGCSAVISSRQQEFLSFQFQLCHRSGDARG
ncbi:MAG: hypothetical protein Q8L02_06345 [Candidatus Nitrotoga sp.]|nr:hypothetical protein [Candidatus Nitrotoga sp.]